MSETTYWPVNEVAMDQSEFSQLWNAFESPGVLGSPGDTSLQAFVSPGAGLFVRPGQAILAGLFTNPANKQITVPVNASGVARLDLLALRLNLNAPTKPVLTYVPGGATAPAPQYDPAGVIDIPLAVCTLPSGSVVPSVVTDVRGWSPTDVIPCYSVADIPASRRRYGTLAAEFSTGRLRMWNGSAWRTVLFDEAPQSYTPQWISSTGATAVGSGGEIVGRYTRVGLSLVQWRFRLLLGSGASGGPGTDPAWRFTLPVTALAANPFMNIVGHGQVKKGGIWLSAEIHRHQTLSSSFVVVVHNQTREISGQTPSVWNPGDEIRAAGLYEVEL